MGGRNNEVVPVVVESKKKEVLFAWPAKKDEEMEQKEKVLAWFIRYTTIGGLSQFNLTDIKTFKAIWLLLFLAGAVLTFINVRGVLINYYANRVITTMSRTHNKTLEFPAITFCSTNKVHCRNLHGHIMKMKRENQSKRADNLCQIFFLGKCQTALNLSDAFQYGKHNTSDPCIDIPPRMNYSSISPLDYNNPNLLDSMLDKLSSDDRFAIAHQPEQLFKSCTFQNFPSGRGCLDLLEGKSKLISPGVGVCYSFNRNTSLPPLKATLTGEAYGLALEIDVDSRNSLMRGLTDSAGIKVVVHERNKIPLCSTQGIVLPTNTLSKVALEAEHLVRQPAPYTSMCKDSWDLDMPYQEPLCQSFCVDDYIQKLCNCTATSIIEMDRNLSGVCDYSDPKLTICLTKIQNDLESTMAILNAQCEKCQPQCEENNYQLQLSQINWPSFVYWPVLAEKYRVMFNNIVLTEARVIEALSGVDDYDNSSTILMAREIQTSISENFLKVQIFFSSKTVTEILEMPEYDTEGLMTTLGGAISFYLGFSIVSAFEVAELGLRTLLRFFKLH